MTLRFNDGISINTSGELRKLHLRDGWYVVGHGLLMPVEDEKDADEFIKQLKKGEEDDPT